MFRDVKITRDGNTFSSLVYIIPTTTLLGTNYFSFFSLTCRFYRAYKIIFDSSSFDTEVSYLRKFSGFNFFPTQIVDKYINNFLNNIFGPKQAIPAVGKKVKYLEILYIVFYTSISQRNL